jgi:hypothetical protein
MILKKHRTLNIEKMCKKSLCSTGNQEKLYCMMDMAVSHGQEPTNICFDID